MIEKNRLLAQFWANANQIVTGDGIEIGLDMLMVLLAGGKATYQILEE